VSATFLLASLPAMNCFSFWTLAYPGHRGHEGFTTAVLRSIKEKDWTREKNGIASAGSATGRGIVKAGTWTGSTISGGVKSLFTKKPAA